MSEDDTNPKDLIGVTKCPLRFVPPALAIEAAPAMANGAAKYGPYNWRSKKVRMTVYLEAIQRHLYALLDGEDIAADSGATHVGHIAACCGIIADARAGGNLIDDRPVKGPAPAMLGEQATANALDEYVLRGVDGSVLRTVRVRHDEREDLDS